MPVRFSSSTNVLLGSETLGVKGWSGRVVGTLETTVPVITNRDFLG